MNTYLFLCHLNVTQQMLPIEEPADTRSYQTKVAGRDDIEIAFLSASEIARELARLAAAYSSEASLYQPVETVEELGRTLLDELDFRRELRNLQMFRANFENDPRIRFPRPFPEFSTGRVLVMERLQGRVPGDVPPYLAAGWVFEATDEERRVAQAKLNAMPRDASPTRQRNRCAITGRPHGVYRKFGLGRNKLREAAMRGDVPGLVKASW